MIYWLAGLSSAGIAWICNRYLVRKKGDLAVIWIVPILEETIKTGMAVFLKAPVALTHNVFGLIEAVHDYTAGAQFGFWSAISSIIGHWMFGQVTIFIFNKSYSWFIAITLTGIIHIFWNYAMVFIFTYFYRLKKRK